MLPLLCALAALGGGLAVATEAGAEEAELLQPSIYPDDWSRTDSLLGSWIASGIDLSLNPRTIVLLYRDDGDRPETIWGPQPLRRGLNATGVIDMPDLGEGIHRVVLVVDGFTPLTLGMLRIDRTPPRGEIEDAVDRLGRATDIRTWASDDLSGLDPARGVTYATAEPGVPDIAGGAGWVPVAPLGPSDEEPEGADRPDRAEDGRGSEGSDGREELEAPEGGALRLPTTHLAEGRHLLRMRLRDRAANTTTLVRSITVDRTPPSILRGGLPVADWQTGELVLHARARDGTEGSGVADLEIVAPDSVRIMGRRTQTVDGTLHRDFHLQMMIRGTTTVTLTATDRAGHIERMEVDLMWPHTRPEPPPAAAPAAPAVPAPIGGPGPPRPQPGGGPADDPSAIPTVPPGGPPGPGAVAGPLERIDPVRARRVGQPAGPGVRRTWLRLRHLHRTRARLALPGQPRVARTQAQWRRALGDPRWTRLSGYTTRSRRVVLGPPATAALEQLERARRRALRPADTGWRPPTRAQSDRWVHAVAVLLHESLHVTGAQMRSDHVMTAADRALEEGLTEAATVDLLPRALAAMALPPRLARPLRAATGRYRPAYLPQVRWVRTTSSLITARPPGSAAARSWRVRSADRLGHTRWQALARQLGPGALARLSSLPLDLHH